MTEKQRGNNLLLPPEILYLILVPLPVKSLLRFRSVCKTWYSLISSPNFVSAQTLNQSTTKRVLLHRRDRRNYQYKFSSHDESFVESREHNDVPEPLRSLDLLIVGSCNGLVCFRQYDPYKIWPGGSYDKVDNLLIWNPSIGKLVRLPSRSSSSSYDISYVFGFGYDPDGNDYKLLRIEYYKPREPSDMDVNVVSVVTEIFDLSKGVWRILSRLMRPIFVEQSCVYLNGNLHWIGDGHSPNCTMLSFNLSGDVFREMAVPGGEEVGEELEEFDDFCAHTTMFPINGLLSVVVLRSEMDGDDCTVWSMKEYGVTESWTKLLYIDLRPFGQSVPWRWVELSRVWENGEVLMLDRFNRGADEEDDCDDLVLYNPESKKSEALLSINGEILNACFYNESLVLL